MRNRSEADRPDTTPRICCRNSPARTGPIRSPARYSADGGSSAKDGLWPSSYSPQHRSRTGDHEPSMPWSASERLSGPAAPGRSGLSGRHDEAATRSATTCSSWSPRPSRQNRPPPLPAAVPPRPGIRYYTPGRVERDHGPPSRSKAAGYEIARDSPIRAVPGMGWMFHRRPGRQPGSETRRATANARTLTGARSTSRHRRRPRAPAGTGPAGAPVSTRPSSRSTTSKARSLTPVSLS